MKYSCTSDQIEGPKFKYNPNQQHLSWLDYEKLWEHQLSFFKRLNYSDGSHRSIVEAENEKLLENKNDKRNNSRFNSIL